jgi:hypothetical protein
MRKSLGWKNKGNLNGGLPSKNQGESRIDYTQIYEYTEGIEPNLCVRGAYPGHPELLNCSGDKFRSAGSGTY